MWSRQGAGCDVGSNEEFGDVEDKVLCHWCLRGLGAPEVLGKERKEEVSGHVLWRTERCGSECKNIENLGSVCHSSLFLPYPLQPASWI